MRLAQPPSSSPLARPGSDEAELRDGLKLSSFTWHKPVQDAEVSGYREVVLDILDAPVETAFRVNGRSYDENRIDAVLPLGKAEEWRAVALNENHPLHIHINPFQVVSIEDSQGRDVTDPAPRVMARLLNCPGAALAAARAGAPVDSLASGCKWR